MDRLHLGAVEQRSIFWESGKESPRTLGIADLPSLADTDGLLWLDLVAPAQEDLAALGKAVNLDVHTLEDALAPHERPKIIHLGTYAFLATYTLRFTDNRVVASRISAYILPNALITIRLADDYDMAPIVERWRQDPHLVQWRARGLLQGLMDVLVDDQFDILETLDTATDDLTRRLFADRPDIKEIQTQTFLLRGQLAALHRVIPQTRDIVASVLRQSLASDWGLELRAYWEDVNDHILRASEWVDALRDLDASIFEASLALNDSRMNEVMKKLAAWAAIIAVPTLITGWFGQNVPYPGFSEPLGLGLAAGLIVVAVAILFVIFKKNDWL